MTNEERNAKIEEYHKIKAKLAQGGIGKLDEIGYRQVLKHLKAEVGDEIEIKPSVSEQCDVLFLTANPQDTTELDLPAEFKKVQIECSDGSNPLAVLPRFGGTEELGKWILQYDPKIVHFAGHGGEDGAIWLEKADGAKAEVRSDAIANLMNLQGWHLDAVFLNLCWSERAAEPFLDIADWVIGMDAEIGDETAIQLALGFYRGLAAGKNVPDSFDWALAEVGLSGFASDIPKLIQGNLPAEADERRKIHRASILELPSGNSETTRSGVDQDRSTLYPLWFGTNRIPNDVDDFSKGFGNKSDKQIWYGKCQVDVPDKHRVGSVGSGFWKRLIKGNDLLTLDYSTLRGLKEAAYWDSVKAGIQAHVDAGETEPTAMVYVHGFWTSFEDAAIRAGQIGFDLALPGAMAFFSWPSKGKFSGYFADSNMALNSSLYLTEFLRGFAGKLGDTVSKIHVLAHSMGNRLVLDAVRNLNQEFERKLFDQVILAAPDVNRDLFLQYAGVYSKIANRTTMYISDRDLALRGSEILNDGDRAGYYYPTTIVSGIDTIRADKVSRGFAHHGYYADSRPILTEIYQLLKWNAAPGNRSLIQPITGGVGGLSWELRE